MKKKYSPNRLLAFLGLFYETKLKILRVNTKSVSNLNFYKTENKNKYANSKIIIDTISEKKIIYNLLATTDLNSEIKQLIKKITCEKEIIDEILYVKHYILFKNQSLYHIELADKTTIIQNKILKIPKKINSIKIELFESYITSDKSKINKLVYEKYITL